MGTTLTTAASSGNPDANEQEATEHAGSRGLALLILTIVAAMALIALFPACQATPLSIDEQVSFFLANGATIGDVHGRTIRQAATPPLPFLAMHALLHATKPAWLTKEMQLRAGGWLLLPLSIGVAFAIGRTVGGWSCGAAAALLLATHSEVLHQSTQARPYAFGLFFNLTAIWILVRLVREGWSWRWAAGLIACNGALLWTHVLAASCLLGQAVLALPLARALAPNRRAWFSTVLAAWATIGASTWTLFTLLPMLYLLHAKKEALSWITAPRAWHQQLELVPAIPLACALAIAIVAGLAATWTRRRLVTMKNARPQFATIAGLGFCFLAPIYLLWGASLAASPTLAQPRYFFFQAGPWCLLAAAALVYIGGQRGGLIAALAFVAIDAGPMRLWDYWRNPIRHDRHWQQAAQLLGKRAGGKDIAFVQSGLVESLLVPVQFQDDEFQGYVCSRLGDFYLDKPLRQWSLPLRWTGGDWLKEYARRANECLADGGTVYLVAATDSDLGQAVAAAAVPWLEQLGGRVELIRDEPVARVWQAKRNL